MKNIGTLKVTTPSDREIVMTRVFDAPRRLVYAALTRPELIQRWLGPHGFRLPLCEVDLKVGGKYRYVSQAPDGSRLGWGGTFREIIPDERIVHTEAFDDYPGEALITTELTENDGKTAMTVTMLVASRDIRDAIIATGMEHGAAECYDRLNELLASLKTLD
ncbi:SRPBCC family protein [Mesorhizobium sp. BAC0120]|uniref:SRPBCC family protein n=1 Tax=Mesorhizobium sp. BAC0120 TaxID=3090670 RepID=UPI00298CEFB0|nr:SRPBCC family protein [Mesorhizobium sp. BAC0120]MDW6020354.1 SRPBCC family protein [Mesorhizobium sp. BAC0120]